ncbi:MAG: hypothetical protein U1E89_08240 [Burkholderiaceae bacterium]
MAKRILVAAIDKPVEALRVAAGLTLIDASLSVALWGPMPTGEAAQAQLEALQFAEVPVDELPAATGERWLELARRIVASDAVYCL